MASFWYWVQRTVQSCLRWNTFTPYYFNKAIKCISYFHENWTKNTPRHQLLTGLVGNIEQIRLLGSVRLLILQSFLYNIGKTSRFCVIELNFYLTATILLLPTLRAHKWWRKNKAITQRPRTLHKYPHRSTKQRDNWMFFRRLAQKKKTGYHLSEINSTRAHCTRLS